MSTIKSSTTTTTAYSVSADTTGTLVIQTGSTPTTAVTVGTDQSVTLAGTLSLASQNMSPYTGFKSRIINGGMTIDQRNAGAVVTNPNGAFPVDRFKVSQYIATTTTQQSTTAPTGYSNSLLITNGTAASPSASFNYRVIQNIEGFNTADFVFGTASAVTITVSFWVRSSLTGTFAIAIQNSAQNRSYVSTYTINSANTFEQKTITIAGDTTGTWIGATNGIGLSLIFDLGSGTDYNTTANAWQAGNYTKTSGCVAFNNTTSATFYITGVQLEKGSTATSFDYRPYGTELALCQRYCVAYASNAGTAVGFWGSLYSTTAGKVFYKHPVTMRASPALTGTSGTGTAFMVAVNGNANGTVGSLAYSNDTTSFDLTSLSSTGTIGQPLIYTGAIVLSAEL